MNIKTIKISQLVPYWRNPRRIPDEAITALMESIERYGYRQPISVDRDNVIIVGHTRFAALKRLGFDEVEVNVVEDLSPLQIRQLRIIDNKSSEFSFWDIEALTEEIGDLDESLMVRFFPEIAASDIQEIVDQDRESMEEAAEKKDWDDIDVSNAVEFVCPSCFHLWQQGVTRADVFAGALPIYDESKELKA